MLGSYEHLNTSVVNEQAVTNSGFACPVRACIDGLSLISSYDFSPFSATRIGAPRAFDSLRYHPPILSLEYEIVTQARFLSRRVVRREQ